MKIKPKIKSDVLPIILWSSTISPRQNLPYSLPSQPFGPFYQASTWLSMLVGTGMDPFVVQLITRTSDNFVVASLLEKCPEQGKEAEQVGRKASRDLEHGRDVRLKLCCWPRKSCLLACCAVDARRPRGSDDGLLRGESREPCSVPGCDFIAAGDQ